jgi:uncharacterized protein
MIAVETNILVYAHRADSPHHEAARERVRELAEGPRWAIPWPCLYEFAAIVTHPRIYRRPSTVTQAMGQIDAWIESPTLSLLSEGGEAWATLRDVVIAGKVAGPAVHEARIGALCLQHGVSVLWASDRDFSRIPELKVVNPLIATRANEPRVTWGVPRKPRRRGAPSRP